MAESRDGTPIPEVVLPKVEKVVPLTIYRDGQRYVVGEALVRRDGTVDMRIDHGPMVPETVRNVFDSIREISLPCQQFSIGFNSSKKGGSEDGRVR
jgi:hypothetical protein